MKALIPERLQSERHEQWEHHGFGYWLVRDRATGEVTGRGGK